MAINLQDVNNIKNSSQAESILDKILRRKERKLTLKQKGAAKRSIQRPWENSANAIESRVQKKSIMSPFNKNNSYTEDELISLIKQKAQRLFSTINIKEL